MKNGKNTSRRMTLSCTDLKEQAEEGNVAEISITGREITEHRSFSEETARIIDEEIQKAVMDMEDRASKILSSNRSGPDALAEELLERETLSGGDIDGILEGGDEEAL